MLLPHLQVAWMPLFIIKVSLQTQRDILLKAHAQQ
jgi:hypothetical protein